MSKVQTFSVITFLSFCIIVGALVFSRGFLLNRQVIHETAGPCMQRSGHVLQQNKDGGHLSRNKGLSNMANWCNPAPTFQKAVLILVDALRHDFVDKMEFLSRALQRNRTSKRSRSGSENESTVCGFKFVADPPTTTMQRLKALMTGTMPTFIDASANFNSYEVEEDSLIHQLYLSGKRIAFLGDDTWLSLFPDKYFQSRFVEAHPSFNAWDLDTVDRAVNKTIRLVFNEQNEWDVLISHLLGVDHCGHRYGPNHPEMTRKLNEANSLIEYVFNSMAEDTLLVVFGDHGMTVTGDHGGDSKDEVESTVIFLSKQSSLYNPPFQCSDQLSISQIDLVPTLAALLGIPIPYSSIGQLIPRFLNGKVDADAVAANVAQVHKYIHHFPTMLQSKNNDNGEEGNSLIQQYESIEDAFQRFQSSPTVTSRNVLQRRAHDYLNSVKFVAVSTWTQFNMPMIYAGLFITAVSVLSLFIYLLSFPIVFGNRSSIAVFSWLSPSLSHWSVLCTFVYHAVASTALLGIIVSTIFGLTVFLLALVKTLLQPTTRNRVTCAVFNFSDVLVMCLYGLSCLAVFSNSFTVYEGQILGFILCAVALTEVLSTKRIIIDGSHETGNMSDHGETTSLTIGMNRKGSSCAWSCFILLLVLLRVSYAFFRCREEQQEYCSEELLLHKQLSSLPEDWLFEKHFRYGVALLTLAAFVVSFRHWMIYRNCILSTKPRALVTRFVPSLLVVFLGVFWALQGLPFISTYTSKIPLLMNYFPVIYQILAVSAIICTVLNPICCVGHLPYDSGTKGYNDLSSPKRATAQPGNCQTSFRSRKLLNGYKQDGSSNGVIKGDEKVAKLTGEDITITFPPGDGNAEFRGCFNEDTYSSCLLTVLSITTLLLVQVTSPGIAPAVILEVYVFVCLVGLFKSSTTDPGSWSSVIAWVLASQYFFYATGHQPIFSAIPWDSAFVEGGDGSGLTSSDAWISWIRAGLAVTGNLHVSQILSSIALPLLVYWSVDRRRIECFMGKSERQKTYALYGKFLALHGLKLLLCMCCACWQRRHLMVWKIFAPKFIFEGLSFIITAFTSSLVMVFVTRICYCHQRFLSSSRDMTI